MSKNMKCELCGEPLLDNGMVRECEHYDSSTYEGREHTYQAYNIPGMEKEEDKNHGKHKNKRSAF